MDSEKRVEKKRWEGSEVPMSPSGTLSVGTDSFHMVPPVKGSSISHRYLGWPLDLQHMAFLEHLGLKS